MLPHEVDDAPATVALLKMRKGERGNFGSPEAAAEKHRKDSPIAQTPHRCDIGRIEKALRLTHRQPVTDADSRRLGAPHPADAGRQLRRAHGSGNTRSRQTAGKAEAVPQPLATTRR